MGLRSVIASAVASGVAALGDLRTSVGYYQPSANTYDPSTGATTRTETVQTIPDAILTSYKQSDIDGDRVLETDRKLIIQTSRLAAEPRKGEDQVDIAGTRWRVQDWKTDPAGATYTIQLRLP